MKTVPDTGTILGPPSPQPVKATITATKAALAMRRARPAERTGDMRVSRLLGGGDFAPPDGGETAVQRDVHVLLLEADGAVAEEEVGSAGVATHERAVPGRRAVHVDDPSTRRGVD